MSLWENAASNNIEKYGKKAVENFKKKNYREGVKDACVSVGCAVALVAKEFFKNRR